jgi:group I intron endonuclease
VDRGGFYTKRRIMYTVYKHTTPNKKVYIGVTSKDVKDRWKNGYGYVHNKYFFNAIKKYGWANIKHEVLFENLSKEQAYQIEVDLIKQYESNNLLFGYNLSVGGESSRAGIKWSEEERKNHIKSLKGRKLTNEEKEKIRCGILKHYDKIGRKSQTNQKDKATKKSRGGKCKKIICVENGMIFNGANEAAMWASLKNKHLIYLALNKYGYHKTAGGYHWEYL